MLLRERCVVLIFIVPIADTEAGLRHSESCEHGLQERLARPTKIDHSKSIRQIL